ncbi:MAG: hypothetical protein M1836_008040 [Candelina mexicana]|nr:MAG: hypothetical protein M1836_008040 [Candelina mexicana]
MSNEDLRHCRKVFHELETLSISLQVLLSGINLLDIQNLQILLSSALNLVNLDLRVDMDHQIFHDNLLWKMFGSQTWSRLRSLKLFGFTDARIEYTEMEDLLLRHGRTLKELTLGSITLQNGGWWRLCQKLRRICVLDGAYMSWLGDDEGADRYPYSNDIGICHGLAYYLTDGKFNSLAFCNRHCFLQPDHNGDWVLPKGVDEEWIQGYIDKFGTGGFYPPAAIPALEVLAETESS